MKRRNLFVLMFAAVLCGCSEDAPESAAGGEIMLRSTVIGANSSSTRSAYEGNDLSDKPLTALVLTSLAEKNYSTLRCEGTMTFNGDAAVKYNKPVTSGDYRFDRTGSVDDILHYLTGLYPADGWTGIATRSRTLTGKEDVMLASEANTTYSAVTSSSTFAELAFKHQLTLLKLKFIREEKDDFTITLQTVSVKSLPTTVSANISADPQTVTFSGNGDVSAYLYNTDTPLSGEYEVETSAAEPYAYVLVPPVTANNAAGAYEYVLHIEYRDELNNPTSQNVSIDLVTDAAGNVSLSGSSAGKANEITLMFKDGSIGAQASVVEWENEGKKQYEI
jgi:hypothetical protein